MFQSGRSNCSHNHTTTMWRWLITTSSKSIINSMLNQPNQIKSPTWQKLRGLTQSNKLKLKPYSSNIRLQKPNMRKGSQPPEKQQSKLKSCERRRQNMTKSRLRQLGKLFWWKNKQTDKLQHSLKTNKPLKNHKNVKLHSNVVLSSKIKTIKDFYLTSKVKIRNKHTKMKKRTNNLNTVSLKSPKHIQTRPFPKQRILRLNS